MMCQVLWAGGDTEQNTVASPSCESALVDLRDILSAASITGRFASTVLPALPAALAWSTSTDGVISVVSPADDTSLGATDGPMRAWATGMLGALVLATSVRRIHPPA
jgi:hypothetical protein